MEVHVVLHEGYALPFDGVHDDHRGILLGPRRLVAGVDDLTDVVAIDYDDVPSKGSELLRQRVERHDLLRVPADLQTVAVHETYQVVEAVPVGEHRCLPVLPLLQLPVPHETVDAVVLGIHLSGQCHSAGHAETLSEGAGRDLDAGHLAVGGMSLQPGTELPEGLEFVRREISPFCECRI